MRYKIQRTSDPAAEPITLARAKEHLRVESDFTLDDDLINAYISAARDQAEKYCNRSFALANFFLLVDGFPDSGAPLYIPDPKTTAVSSITYLDSDQAEQTLSDSLYTLDIDRQQIRITGEWPTPASAIKVAYSAGYDTSASPAELPPDIIQQAMLLLISDMYEIRQSQVAGTIITQNPAAALRLGLYRVEMGV